MFGRTSAKTEYGAYKVAQGSNDEQDKKQCKDYDQS
jgi:hypothetical protein